MLTIYCILGVINEVGCSPYTGSYKCGRMLHSNSLDDHKFVELSTSLVTGRDWAFLKAGPVLWNKLPLQIRSIHFFKRSLKTHLFQLEYNIVYFKLSNIDICIIYICIYADKCNCHRHYVRRFWAHSFVWIYDAL